MAQLSKQNYNNNRYNCYNTQVTGYKNYAKRRYSY